MRIAVFAWLNAFDTRYSVAGVTLDLCQMVLDAGHELVFITREGFSDHEHLPKGAELRLLPEYSGQTPYDGQNLDDLSLERYAFLVGRFLALAVEGCVAVLTQDIAFNPQFLAQFLAMREAISLQEQGPGWIHWSHSVPNPKPPVVGWHLEMCKALPKSRYVALTLGGVPHIARHYGVPEGVVRVVHNFINLRQVWGLSDVAWDLFLQAGGDKHEILLIYPARMDWGKQPQKACRFLRALLELGVSAGLILMLTYAQGEEKQKEYQLLREEIDRLGLVEGHNLAISLGATDNLGLDREQLRGLYRAADCMLHSSTQESFGLTLLEAAAEGCLLIINQDVAAFRELAGFQHSGSRWHRAMMLSWGGAERVVDYHPSEEQWTLDRAHEVLDYVRQCPQHQAHRAIRTRYNSEWVWANQVLPIIEELSILVAHG